MKRLMLVLFLIISCLLCTNVQAQTKTAEITLAWDASDGAIGYKIYRGTTSGGPYNTVVDVGNVLTYKDKITIDGTYYYVATAYDAAKNESDFSDQVSTSVDLTAPNAPKLRITINIILNIP